MSWVLFLFFCLLDDLLTSSPDAPLFTFALKRTLYHLDCKPKGCVNVIAARVSNTPSSRCWFAPRPLFEIHRMFFLLTQVIEFYKEKSNLMNIKSILLTNACRAAIKVLTQFELTFILIHNLSCHKWSNRLRGNKNSSTDLKIL